MITEGEWKISNHTIKDDRDPVFYHMDVICNGTVRVARASGIGKEATFDNARLIAAAPETAKERDKLQKQSDFLTLDLLHEKAKVSKLLDACQEIQDLFANCYLPREVDAFKVAKQATAEAETSLDNEMANAFDKIIKERIVL